MNSEVAALNASAVQKTQRRDLAGAIADCDRAIGLDPEYFESFFNRGMAHKMRGNHDAAIEDFSRAIACFDDKTDRQGLSMLYYMRGSATHDKGESQRNLAFVKKAIEDYNQALKHDPQNPSARQNLEVARRQAFSGRW